MDCLVYNYSPESKHYINMLFTYNVIISCLVLGGDKGIGD